MTLCLGLYFVVNIFFFTGIDNVGATETRQMYLDAACDCPRFRKDEYYLIVGDQGIKFTMASGQEG